MKWLFSILFLVYSLLINAQVIDINNFSEDTMNQVMFDEMNKYVKKIHNGDSLVWSNVIQKDIMTDNYNFIKRNYYKDINKLHNPKWLDRPWNDLPDTIKIKIIDESQGSQIWNKKEYVIFTYTEILAGPFPVRNYTYQKIAQECIINWNKSPGHALYMNANYENKVIVGVTSYYDKKRRMVYISFVYVS